MGIKRHKRQEIVTKVRQIEVLVVQGVARIDAIRQVCIVEQTYYPHHNIPYCIPY